MDGKLYRHYLAEYIREAIANSDGSNRGVAAALEEKTVGGLWVRHKEEKKRALQDARNAFSEYRHWPVEMVLSRLGVELETS